MADQDNHALHQAAAQFDHIKSLVAALTCDYDQLEKLREELEGLTSLPDAVLQGKMYEWDEMTTLEAQAGEFENADAVTDAINEHPLSVQVRSGWYTPGDTQAAQTPEEFEILLCTGGPAVRILGQLDEHGEPHRAWLEYQDWGTPWTMYFPEGDDADDVLLPYCQQFYFGA